MTLESNRSELALLREKQLPGALEQFIKAFGAGDRKRGQQYVLALRRFLGEPPPEDAPWKYVAALAGSDIQTNPPATNDAVERSGQTFTKAVEQMPADAVLHEIDTLVAPATMHEVLMAEGIQKFVDPQRALLALIASKRAAVVSP